MNNNRIVNAYNHLEEFILVILFSVMVLVTFGQVVMRFVFNNSLSWADEFARFLFVWLTWLGVSIGQKTGEHIKITMLVDKVPFRIAHIINIFADIIVIIICIVTINYSAIMTKMMLGSNYVSLHFSYAWGYAAIPISCTLMILRILPSINNSIKNLKAGPQASNAKEGIE
ncbi:MAG: TRAP transporter small permease [Parabacteroides sp.]|nr:TRAP transporter small permease [Parabacteroides sp.]